MFKKTLREVSPQTETGKTAGTIIGVAVVAYIIHLLHIGTTILSVFILAFAAFGTMWVVVRRCEKAVIGLFGGKQVV